MDAKYVQVYTPLQYLVLHLRTRTLLLRNELTSPSRSRQNSPKLPILPSLTGNISDACTRARAHAGKREVKEIAEEERKERGMTVLVACNFMLNKRTYTPPLLLFLSLFRAGDRKARKFVRQLCLGCTFVTASGFQRKGEWSERRITRARRFRNPLRVVRNLPSVHSM